MHSIKKISLALKGLLDLVEEEASRNPDFAQRLDAITAELPLSKPKNRDTRIRKSATEVVAPDVLSAFESKGEQEFGFWLREFNLATLKAIVRTNGFDPGKTSQRWTEPDKFIALISEQTSARFRRGSAFLPPKATPDSAEPM